MDSSNLIQGEDPYADPNYVPKEKEREEEDKNDEP